MSDLSISASRFLATATTNAFLVLKLDEIWTLTATNLSGELQKGTSTDVDVVGGLNDVVDDLERSLRQMAKDASDLAGLAKRYAGAADETLMSVLWGDLLSAELRDQLRWWIPYHGGLVVMADHFVEVLEDVDVELKIMRAEVDRLRQGQPNIGGGLTRKFKCAVVQGLIVGGILSLPSGVLGLPTTAARAAIISGTAAAGVAIVGAAALLAQKLSC